MNVSLKASSWKRKALVPALAALTLLGAGCSQQKVPPRQQEADRQALAADSLHMARLYSRWTQAAQAQAASGGLSREMPIDLSDEAQYRFVKNRMLASGSTPENSPRLFQRLEALRKQKTVALPRMGKRKAALAAEGSGGGDKQWCGQILALNDVKSEDASLARFQTSGLVTCFDGSDYAYADVSAFVTDLKRTRFRMLASQSFEDFAGATLETPPLDLSVQAHPDELLVVDSVAIAFDEETGASHVSYAVAESSVVSLGMMDFNHIDVTHGHPREITGHTFPENPIRICLERGSVDGYLDCDYASGNWDPVTNVFQPFVRPHNAIAANDPEASWNAGGRWVAHGTDRWRPEGGYDDSHLYIPMRGDYRVAMDERCTVDKITGKATIVLMEEGGYCAAGTAEGTEVREGNMPLGDHFMDPYRYRTLVVPFDGLGDFGSDCLRPMQDIRLVMETSLEATCPGPIMNLAGTQPYTRSTSLSIERLDFRNLCLAEGTRVVKADGTKVPVEKVGVGDKLLANGSGLALTVTTVSRGSESKPMVKLRDTQGGEVMMTETHPLVTATRGVVQANELKVGDAVVARDGVRTLAAVERVPYDGQVYNFALGTPEELAGVGPEGRTLYANGFLVGDSHMQSELEKTRKLDAREVLARLHGSWHEDFRHHQAKLKRARR